MSPDDKFLIVAKRVGAAIDPMHKVHFRLTLAGARGLADNLIRKLNGGLNGESRGIEWEACIFDLTLVEVVSPTASER